MADLFDDSSHITSSMADDICDAKHNPHPAGIFGRTRPAEGDGADSVPCLTRERVAVARRARRQSIALNEYFLSNFKNFLESYMSGQGQVKGKNRHFSPYRLLRRD